MFVPSPSGSWRIDRRTFLKLLGVGGAGLLASGSIGALLSPLTATRVAAATGPIDDLALALEFDTERIFRFVSERIRYEPYAGVLRGAEGTLMARAGNSADQAVLLAALLKASGTECRYAQGSIDAATEATLVAAAVTDLETGRQEITEAITGTGEGGRPLTTEPDAGTLSRLEAAAPDGDRVLAWARTALASGVSMIEAALSADGISLPTDFTGLPVSERDGHLWIQAASGPNWLDLDPSLPGFTMGDAASPAALTHESVPDDLRHLVTFKVIAETVAGDGLAETTLLETSEFADVLAGKPVAVLNIERQGLKALGSSITESLEGGTTYLPCVVLGDTVVAGPGVLRFGGNDDAFADEAIADTAFGPIVPGEGDPTAEWVEVAITSPGEEPILVRREMFDRLGPAARSTGTLDRASLPPVELTQLEPDGPPDYLPAQRSHWLMVHTGIVGGEALGEALLSQDLGVTLANAAHVYHTIREGGGAELGMPSGTRTYLDAPNLVALTVDQEQGDALELRMRTRLDIWHRSFGVVPVSGIDPASSPRLIAGVASQVAERLAFGEASRDPGVAGSIASVGAVFDAARRDGLGLRVLRAPEDAAALPYAPDALVRLRDSLADGWLAVAPERTVLIGEEDRAGWWLIDPLSGRAVDQMDDGRGEEMGGYLTIEYGSFRASIPIRRMAVCAAWIAAMTAGILSIYGGVWQAVQGAAAGSGLAGGLGAVAAAGGAALAVAGFGGAVEAGCN
jgi:transglutaminase-like putative cysteine protease